MAGNGDIGSIPGTEAIQKQVQKWRGVNTGEFQQTQQSLSKAAEQAGNSHKQLQSSIGSLGAAWTGKDADSYKDYMQTFSDASKAAHDLLNQGVNTIKGAVEQLDQAKTQMEAALGKVADSYNEKKQKAESAYNAANDDFKHGKAGPPQPVNYEALGQQAAAEHQGEIDNAEKQAEQAMKKLSTELSQQTSNMKAAYQGVPSPGQSGGVTAKSSPIGGVSTSGSSSGGGGGAAMSGGASGGMGSSGGPPSSGPPPGNVNQWIDQAIAELQKNGIKVGPEDKKLIWQIIEKESGGDPHAINNWDSNAQKGTPSKGLMQCIDPTFQSNKLPGHDDIYNPVDNICAGVKYSISRYGSLSEVPGIKAMASGGGYQGY